MKLFYIINTLFLLCSCSSFEKSLSPEEEYLSTKRKPCFDEDGEKSYNCFIKKKSYDTLTYFSQNGTETKELKFQQDEKSN
jgi:hypothetical protein